jgi:hypothetical protein
MSILKPSGFWGVALEKTRVSLGLADDFADGIIAKRLIELAKAGEHNPDLLCQGRNRAIARAFVRGLTGSSYKRPRPAVAEDGVATTSGYDTSSVHRPNNSVKESPGERLERDQGPPRVTWTSLRPLAGRPP